MRHFGIMSASSFSIGGLHGWQGVLLGTLASVVFLVSGWQDVAPGIGMLSSGFWFFLALLFAGGVAWLGGVDRIRGGPFFGLALFCAEAWLISRWWRKARQPER